MASISKQDLDDRITRFIQYVRSCDSGFKPNESWWMTRDTPCNRDNLPNAFSFVEQIGVSINDMRVHYGRCWATKIGVSLFQPSSTGHRYPWAPGSDSRFLFLFQFPYDVVFQIPVIELASISKQDLDDRVASYVNSDRSDDNSVNFGFRPSTHFSHEVIN